MAPSPQPAGDSRVPSGRQQEGAMDSSFDWYGKWLEGLAEDERQALAAFDAWEAGYALGKRHGRADALRAPVEAAFDAGQVEYLRRQLLAAREAAESLRQTIAEVAMNADSPGIVRNITSKVLSEP